MPITRSENMARIKSGNTKPEILLRKALWHKGYRYKLNRKIGNIRPDIVLVSKRIAIFVDGCQWHGCPEHYVPSRTRTDFWQAKLLENIERDTKQTKFLKEQDWSIIRVWEHEIWENLSKTIEKIEYVIKGKQITEIENWRAYRVDTIDPGKDLERRYMRLLEYPETIKVVERFRSTKKWNRSKKNLIKNLENNDNK